ncbi:hypothetical protein J4209_00775 [Candidatus Woesearchaeota archaeon]|nr:hypothetical protein [Candidatus Woesearchaeota archaeon]
MSLLTVALFFIYTWGLGFTAAFFIKNSPNFLERNLMRIGIGLGIFPILSVIFNLLRIPLDWRIFLIASLILPLYFGFKQIKEKKFPEFKFSIKKSNLAIFVVLLLFLATFYMYHKGAFSYPYLEDDDPWVHTKSVKYVAIEKTAFEPSELKDQNVFLYMDSYPPGYDILMGILHQTSPHMVWTLKFFNALIISLSIIFFYFFVNEFSGNRNKALFSTFVLFAIPSYLSHFIWAISLSVVLFFPAFYSLERIKHDNKWKYVAALVIASIMVVQPTHAIKFGILFAIYWGIKAIVEKKLLLNIFSAGIGGLIVSFIFWWVPMFMRYGGVRNTLASLGSISKGLHVPGSADRLYTFSDFFIARTTNMINNPIGVGAVIIILLIFTIIFILYYQFKIILKNLKESRLLSITLFILLGLSFLALLLSLILIITNLFIEFKIDSLYSIILTASSILFLTINHIILIIKGLEPNKKVWIPVTLAMLVFTFLGIHGARLPISLVAFRFWMLFAIPTSILVSEGMWFLMSLGKIKIAKFVLLVFVVIAVLSTSFYPKYAVNTAMWGPGGGWTSMEEIQGYMWLKTLPVNTPVFSFTDDSLITGLDMYSCSWCKEVREFRKDAINKSSFELNSWFRKNNYEYVLLGGREAVEFGANETNNKLNEMLTSGLFQVAYQTNGVIIMKVIQPNN